MGMKNSSTSLYSPLVKKAYKLFCESCDDAKMLEAAKGVWKDLVVKDSGHMKRAAGHAKVYLTFKNGKRRGVERPSIKLSKELMNRMDGDEQFDTITHELAHIIDFAYRLNSDHGPIWKKIHSFMGGSGKQFHSIDTKDLRKKRTRFLVICRKIWEKNREAVPMAWTKARLLESIRSGNVRQGNGGFYRVVGVVTLDGYNKKEKMEWEEIEKRGLADIVRYIAGE